MIIRVASFVTLIGLALLMTACLDDLFPPVNYEVQQVLRLDPPGKPYSASEFYHPYYGRAYSFDSKHIFYIGNYLRRKTISNLNIASLLPSNMRCTDKTWLAADSLTQKLYVAAENSIYSLKFDGSEFQNLTPANVDTLTSPALSPDKRYLTFIRSGKINRLDLQTGTRVEIDNSPAAEYAIYRPEQDRYYYFSPYGITYGRELYVCESDGSAAQRMMWDDGPNTVYAVSADGRWFGLLNQPDKIVNQTNSLRIWDSDAGSAFVLSECSAFAFSPTSTELYYSQKVFGSTNLVRMTLGTPHSQMLFDGIISAERYFYPIWEITPKATGDYLFFRGFTYKYTSSLED